MNVIERIATRVRHMPGLRRLNGLWNWVRPAYEKMVDRMAGDRGLVRCINGMDEVRLVPQRRSVSEIYEPEVWKMLLPQVKPGDCIADIGANLGLYAVAFAKRTGPAGKVLAFEPDPPMLELLRAHIQLNGVEGIVEVVPCALTDRECEAEWHSQELQSFIKPDTGGDGPKVQMTTLDRIAANRRVDLMLIDIEGHEEPALRGGAQLLKDPSRRPRLIVIEVHPFNWALYGVSSGSLLSFLTECGYAVRTLEGVPVTEISEYGHVIAVPHA